jgi:hypothetical protein
MGSKPLIWHEPGGSGRSAQLQPFQFMRYESARTLAAINLHESQGKLSSFIDSKSSRSRDSSCVIAAYETPPFCIIISNVSSSQTPFGFSATILNKFSLDRKAFGGNTKMNPRFNDIQKPEIRAETNSSVSSRHLPEKGTYVLPGFESSISIEIFGLSSVILRASQSIGTWSKTCSRALTPISQITPIRILHPVSCLFTMPVFGGAA